MIAGGLLTPPKNFQYGCSIGLIPTSGDFILSPGHRLKNEKARSAIGITPNIITAMRSRRFLSIAGGYRRSAEDG
jgi:hypothetical protein